MELSDSFRLANLGIGAIMILGGISQFFGITLQSAIIGSYVIIFGLATGFLEFQIPPYMAKYASFYFSFLGRGIFYIFTGSILLSGKWPRIVGGSIIGIVGVAYVILEFIPSIEPPQNMRDASAEAGWGAEQV